MGDRGLPHGPGCDPGGALHPESRRICLLVLGWVGGAGRKPRPPGGAGCCPQLQPMLRGSCGASFLNVPQGPASPNGLIFQGKIIIQVLKYNLLILFGTPAQVFGFLSFFFFKANPAVGGTSRLQPSGPEGQPLAACDFPKNVVTPFSQFSWIIPGGIFWFDR